MIGRRKTGWLDAWVSVEDGAGNTSLRKRCLFRANAEGVFRNVTACSFRMRTDLEPGTFRVWPSYGASVPMSESQLVIGEDMRKALESAVPTSVPEMVDISPGSIELWFRADSGAGGLKMRGSAR